MPNHISYATPQNKTNLLGKKAYTGIVLCAGLGQRLRPLTHWIPKPCIPMGSLPLAGHVLQKLRPHCTGSIHVNTHYLSDVFPSQFEGLKEYDFRLWPEEHLLGTGGGIARILHQLWQEDSEAQNRDVIVVSGDIYSSMSLEPLLEAWEARTDENTVALMVCRPLDGERNDTTWVHGHRIVGFGPKALNDQWQPYLFNNYQILSAAFVKYCLDHFQRTHGLKTNFWGPGQSPSSIDLFYRPALRWGLSVGSVLEPPGALWFNVGELTSYVQCLEALGGLKGSQRIFQWAGYVGSHQSRWKKTLLNRPSHIQDMLPHCVITPPSQGLIIGLNHSCLSSDERNQLHLIWYGDGFMQSLLKQLDPSSYGERSSVFFISLEFWLLWMGLEGWQISSSPSGIYIDLNLNNLE